jgi:hypothetical protein
MGFFHLNFWTDIDSSDNSLYLQLRPKKMMEDLIQLTKIVPYPEEFDLYVPRCHFVPDCKELSVV